MSNEIVIFKELTTDEAIQEIEEQSKQFLGLVVDMDKDSERKKVKESAQVINDILKKVDRARIDYSKEYKLSVESEAKSIRERLEEANKPLTELIDAHKEKRQKILDAEKARKESIELAFNKLTDSAMEAIGQSSSVIEGIIDDVAAYDFNPDVFQERTNEAVDKHADLMGKLNEMLKAQLASEELESKRAEIEEKERLQKEADDRAERIEREAEIAEQARIEAEERHKAELEEREERAKQEAKAAEVRAKQQAEQAEKDAIARAELAAKAERERIEAEELERIEAEKKRESNRKHKAKIHTEIVNSFVTTGISVDAAKELVKLIASGKAGSTYIKY